MEEIVSSATPVVRVATVTAIVAIMTITSSMCMATIMFAATATRAVVCVV